MITACLINFFLVSALWGMDDLEKSGFFDNDELNSSFFDHDDPNAKPKKHIVPVNQNITPSFNEIPIPRPQPVPQILEPKYESQKVPMNQSSLGSDFGSQSNLGFDPLSSGSSLDLNRFNPQSNLQPIPQLQPTIEPVRPVILAVTPSKKTMIAIQNNHAPYFQQKQDLLIQSLPYFLSHDSDSDQAKINAKHILKMIKNQLDRKKENKECQNIIQNAINRIDNGYSSESYIIPILHAYDKTKFPENSTIQKPEISKLNVLKEQLALLKTRRMSFIEGNTKPTPEWLIGVKKLFEAITSDIILGLSQLKAIKTNTELENIKASLLENINFMISSIEALDATLILGSERRLKLISLYKFIRTLGLDLNPATMKYWIEEVKKIKIATIEKIENPETLETSSLLMQKAGTNLKTQEVRAKRKPILRKLRNQNIIIRDATEKIRLSKIVQPNYINLLMERIETLNEYLTLISPDERELKRKIKNDILDDLDRINIYTIKTKKLLNYPSLKPSDHGNLVKLKTEYRHHPAQYFIDVDKNIADNDLESLKIAFDVFFASRMVVLSEVPKSKLLNPENGLQIKKAMFDKFLADVRNDEIYELMPILLNQIYTYKQLTGLGAVSAEIVKSNKEMINSILEHGLQKNQNTRLFINLINDIIESTSFTPQIDRQACLMLSYAILEKTYPLISKTYNSFFNALNTEINIKQKTTIFSIIDEITKDYYQKKQLKAAIEGLTTLAALLPALTLDLSGIPNEQLDDYLKKAEQLQDQFDKNTSSKVALEQISQKITQEIAERNNENVEEKPQKALNPSSSDDKELADNPEKTPQELQEEELKTLKKQQQAYYAQLKETQEERERVEKELAREKEDLSKNIPVITKESHPLSNKEQNIELKAPSNPQPNDSASLEKTQNSGPAQSQVDQEIMYSTANMKSPISEKELKKYNDLKQWFYGTTNEPKEKATKDDAHSGAPITTEQPTSARKSYIPAWIRDGLNWLSSWFSFTSPSN